MNPLISIIIPVYNIASKIKPCIHSILQQSCQEFEIIVVDDGSNDGSGNICDEFQNLKNIQIIHQPNSGVTAARQKGIENAHGEWICFVDGDDTLPTDSLQVLIDNSHNVDIVVGNVIPITPTGEMLKKESVSEAMLLSSTDFIKKLLEHKIGTYPVGRLFKRSLFDHSTLDLPRNIRRGEDFIMNIRLAAKAKQIRVISNHVYNYIQYPDSSLHRFVNSWNYEKVFDKHLMESLQNAHLQHTCKESIIHAHIRSLLGGLTDPELSRQDSFFKQIKKEAKEVALSKKEKAILFLAGIPFPIRKRLYVILKKLSVR